MSRNDRRLLATAIAFVAIAATYIMAGSSTAYSDRSESAAPRIDVLAIMTEAKSLPSEQFDAI